LWMMLVLSKNAFVRSKKRCMVFRMDWDIPEGIETALNPSMERMVARGRSPLCDLPQFKGWLSGALNHAGKFSLPVNLLFNAIIARLWNTRRTERTLY
jgi:hypothetical protein